MISKDEKPLMKVRRKRNLTLRDLYFKINKEIELTRLSDIQVGREAITKKEIEILNKYLELSEQEIEGLEEMEIDSLNIEVGMGNAEVKGSINHEVIVDCGMGQAILELEGEGKDFNYNLDCGLGSLSVEGVYHIAGIGDSYVNNDASMEMDLSVGMGTVTVSFEE